MRTFSAFESWRWTGISAWWFTSPKTPIAFPSGPMAKRSESSYFTAGVRISNTSNGSRAFYPANSASKVTSMTFPGRFYFLDGSRDWPGDVENNDGSARTPLWTRETEITPDQYAVIKDQSKRKSYGTLVSLSAKPGTEFFRRMAAWPIAKQACRSFFV